MEAWICNELRGYENIEAIVPDYRKIRGEVILLITNLD